MQLLEDCQESNLDTKLIKFITSNNKKITKNEKNYNLTLLNCVICWFIPFNIILYYIIKFHHSIKLREYTL
jgi:hypothetical protein